MRKGLVIADDLSGAAEIAGIAHRYGLTARIFRGYPHEVPAQINIIDSDTRSLNPQGAHEKLRDRLAVIRLRDFDFFYKKTDSALRGPVAAEIETVLMRTGKTTAVLVPNNPSRSRTISGGIYRIDGIPLAQTSFANDPQHPATTSDVAKLISIYPDSAISIPDSTTAADIESCATSVSQGTHILPAGGADFFQAILHHYGYKPNPGVVPALDSPSLFVCGTSAPTAAELAARAAALHIPITSILDDAVPLSSPCTLLNINRPIDPSPETARYYQTQLAARVNNFLRVMPLSTLFIDGGATAAAVCEKLNWHTFTVLAELSPGIVTLEVAHSAAPLITIKPGSYRWPEELLEHRFRGN